VILKRPTTVIDRHPQAATYLSIATFVSIARWRHVPNSFRLSNRVERQLKRSPGIVAYSLVVDLPRRRFWTYTVWSDPAAVPAFTQSEPHATAGERFRDWAGEERGIRRVGIGRPEAGLGRGVRTPEGADVLLLQA